MDIRKIFVLFCLLMSCTMHRWESENCDMLIALYLLALIMMAALTLSELVNWCMEYPGMGLIWLVFPVYGSEAKIISVG